MKVKTNVKAGVSSFKVTHTTEATGAGLTTGTITVNSSVNASFTVA
jgi:hypothetical protein